MSANETSNTSGNRATHEYAPTRSNANAAANAATSEYDMAKGMPLGEEGGRANDRYAKITENPFLEVSRAPLSTFAVDVDTASYSNVRRFINDGQRPPADSVRIEELVNYFKYDYPQPAGNAPFSVTTETAECPWNPNNRLVSIGLQGKKMMLESTPPANLVFLLDVSGSMNSADKLPLLKQGLRMMIDQLKPQDRIAIAVYAGASGLVLPSTSVTERGEILAALDSLEAGGSTNGGDGIKLAYTVAENNFIKGGNNRVILATDGDFNVGITGDDALVKLIEEKRKSGVFLSVLGFGRGNLNDSMMEKLANKGNGNYAYIDSFNEAKRALGEQVSATLNTIAKDVKIQVEFNPALVAGYRLIGYENRLLAARDFDDDTKDAGEIGAGHSVTALYEIVPAGQNLPNNGVELKYSEPATPANSKFANELMTVKLRYKEPAGTESKLLTAGVLNNVRPIGQASVNLRFAAAVAEFGLLLRDSRYKGNAGFANVQMMAQNSLGSGMDDSRSEFLEMTRKAERLISE